jgi:HSP20 family molecular chaperone IbpA
VEDAPDDSGKADQSSTEVAKQSSTDVSEHRDSDGPKYWVAERSVGEFHRSWKFPARLDEENIKASLKDGILSIVVPKLKAQPPKKINIQ